MPLIDIDDLGHQLLEDPGHDWLRLRDVAEDKGFHVVVNSAYRSVEKQRALYSDYIHRCAAWERSGRLGAKPLAVAWPGGSEHNHGNALDVEEASVPGLHEWLMKNSSSFNFWFTALREKHHLGWYSGAPPQRLLDRHLANLKMWR